MKERNQCLPGNVRQKIHKRKIMEKRISQPGQDERASQAKGKVSAQTWRHERALPVWHTTETDIAKRWNTDGESVLGTKLMWFVGNRSIMPGYKIPSLFVYRWYTKNYDKGPILNDFKFGKVTLATEQAWIRGQAEWESQAGGDECLK